MSDSTDSTTAPDPTPTHGAHDLRGTLIADRYKVLSLLGEGGFGLVYEAEQTHPIRRRVALGSIYKE